MKKDKKEIRLKMKFYNWAVKNGLDLKNLEVENLDFEVSTIEKSNLKSRSKEIKEKYNHRFNFPVESTFKGFATLERFILERI
jgi:hypothetical protein